MTQVTTSDGGLLVIGHHGPPIGERDNPPLVLLHGLSQQRHFWLPIVRRMPNRSIITIDQRGHGDADTPFDADYRIERCALDIREYLDSAGIQTIVLVGHSWGASVALHLAAANPALVAALALIDGAIVTPADLGDRSDVRVALTPPKLGAASLEAIFAMMKQGSLGPYWNAELEGALGPTFGIQGDGTWGTKLGFARHMRVLDDFFEYQPGPDWARLQPPTWLICCDAAEPWLSVRDANLANLHTPANLHVQVWGGATHDVPLQWPSLVAGLFDTVWSEAVRGVTA